MAESENIVLIARLKVKNDAIEEAKQAALELIAPSRAEAGCLNYDFHQSLDDASIFIWHETWKNKDAIEAHGKMPHFVAFSEKVSEITEEPLQLIFTKMISTKA